METDEALPPPPPPPPPSAAPPAAPTPAPAQAPARAPLPPQEALLADALPEVAPLVPIRRRGQGTLGRPTFIYVNFFPIKFTPPDQPVIQYQVDFTRDGKAVPVKKGGNLEPRAVVKLLLQQHPAEFGGPTPLAFDGERAFFSLGALPFPAPRDFEVDVDAGRGGRARIDGDGDVDGRRVRARGSPLLVTVTQTPLAVPLGTILQHVNGGAIEDGTALGVESAMRGLDVALRHFASERFISIKDSIFLTRAQQRAGNLPPNIDLKGGVEAWHGYKAAVRLVNGGGGIALNLDVVTAAIVKPLPVLEYALQVLGYTPGRPPPARFTDQECNRLRRALKSLKVETIRRPGERTEKKKVQDLTRLPASEAMFPLRQGDETVDTTVADYYANKRHQPLHFPHLPCIDVGRRGRPTWWPLEVCQIVDAQTYMRQLSMQQIADLGRHRLPPQARKDYCSQAVRVTGMDQEPLLRSWGMHVAPEMMRIPARILPAPHLAFGNGPPTEPANGVWNIVGKTMFEAGGVDKWAIASPWGMAHEELQDYARQLARVCEAKGVTLPPPPGLLVCSEAYRGPTTREACTAHVKYMLMEKMAAHGPKIVVWVLESKTSAFYAPIKTLCETEVLGIGIVSQCFVPSAQQRGGGGRGRGGRGGGGRGGGPGGNAELSDQYLANIALKINIKLGKTNWVVGDLRPGSTSAFGQMIQGVPTMVLGMDVGHGSPGGQSPSVAAVVASMDMSATRYAVEVRTQMRRQETIAGLWDPDNKGDSMMCKLLNAFGEKHKVAPLRLIIYRDGVSESQFPATGGKEVHAIREACKHMAQKMGLGDWMPKITYIVAQKRNNTRLFLDNINTSLRQTDQNPTPGTVVDTDICHPLFFDFYLNAHQGLLGSSRPVHFHVLQDDSDFSADEIQWLTHSLCYSYGRCTQAVSTVAPVFYAHLAAAHCRKYLDHDDGSDTASVRSDGSGVRGQRMQAAPEELKKVVAGLQDSMFFC